MTRARSSPTLLLRTTVRLEFAVDMSAASILEHRKLNLDHRIIVADAEGKELLTVKFGDVLTVQN
jgi:hypothetical protein